MLKILLQLELIFRDCGCDNKVPAFAGMTAGMTVKVLRCFFDKSLAIGE